MTPTVALLLVLCLVVLVAGCGGGDGDPLTVAGLRLSARFEVKDGELAKARGDAAAIAQGRRLWARVDVLAPHGLRREISGFGVYAPLDDTTGFSRRDERGSGWLVALEPDTGTDLDVLALHELAHVATLDPTQVDAGGVGCGAYATDDGCMLPGSCLRGWVDRFWNPKLGGPDPTTGTADERWRANPGAFLGPHAALTPAEDLATVFSLAMVGHPLATPVLQAKAAVARTCSALAPLRVQAEAALR